VTLTDLEATFRRIIDDRADQEDVPFAEAQGIRFLCPKCFEANGGAAGTHSVLCWFADKGVPADKSPGPARWPATGTGVEDITLTPSVLLLGGCGWHGWIKNGVVTSC
jgi:hypothetical protein